MEDGDGVTCGMRAYHLYCDHWTVFDDDGNEWSVGPADKNGKRHVTTTTTTTYHMTHKAIAVVEQRSLELGDTDWRAAHKRTT